MKKELQPEHKQAYNSLVTGGANGIGKTIAEKLRKRGDNVFIFDCLPEDDEKVKDIKNYICVDISNVESIKKGFEKLFSLTSRIDILVNNAGITRDNIAIRMKEKDWDDVLSVNLKGTFFCSQKAIASMMKQGKGYIVNISSIVGIHGNPGQVNYSASKAGVIAITKTLAKEYASRNIIVNSIAPGFIKTAMTEKLSDKIKSHALSLIPLKRFGETEDIANLLLFLTSGNADYITGQVITVDGGMF